MLVNISTRGSASYRRQHLERPFNAQVSHNSLPEKERPACTGPALRSSLLKENELTVLFACDPPAAPCS